MLANTAAGDELAAIYHYVAKQSSLHIYQQETTNFVLIVDRRLFCSLWCFAFICFDLPEPQRLSR